MNKWYFLSAVAFLLAGMPGSIGAQETQPTDTKIIIIEEKIDQHGNKTVEKSVREGKFTDEEIDRIIAEESRLDQGMGKKRGYLGVMIDNGEAGVRVTEVMDDSPAKSAGLQVNDQITTVGGKSVTSIEGLVEVVSSHAPGEAVEIRFLRDGNPQTVSVTLAERQEPAIEDGVFEWDEHVRDQREREEEMERAHEEMNRHHEKMEQEHARAMERQEEIQRQVEKEVARHMEALKERPDNKPRFGVYLDEVEAGPGVRVTRVTEGSVAEGAGLVKGDVITMFNGVSVNSTEDLIQAVKGAPADKKVKVEFIRQGKKIKEKVVFPQS